jgi:hypothetical protein
MVTACDVEAPRAVVARKTDHRSRRMKCWSCGAHLVVKITVRRAGKAPRRFVSTRQRELPMKAQP